MYAFTYCDVSDRDLDIYTMASNDRKPGQS